jgi:hypothetical protein
MLAEKQRRDEAKKPCTSCGKPLFGPDGSLYIRLIGASEQPCSDCEQRAAEIAPNKQLHVQIPFARKDLDPEAEQRAGDLAFIWSCRYEHGMSDDDIRARYADHYPDLADLLAELDPDGPEAA